MTGIQAKQTQEHVAQRNTEKYINVQHVNLGKSTNNSHEFTTAPQDTTDDIQTARHING